LGEGVVNIDAYWPGWDKPPYWVPTWWEVVLVDVMKWRVRVW